MMLSKTCGDSPTPGDALTLFRPFFQLPEWLLVSTFGDASTSGDASTCGQALSLPSYGPS